ncbi:MAG: hypothetical protein JO306_00915 [Gemmatimonadetes bacterium]|nr:hypothetical protein [Gemmatimonadota bacterium]
MSIAISRRDRRVLAIGAGVIALLLLVSRGVPAWRRWDADARTGAAELLRDEAEARTQVRILPALVDSAEARRNRLSRLAPSLLDGESAASAGATLASILTGAAARAGVRLGSVQVAADTASASTFTRVSVRADATGDLQGITEMLQSLETAPELLAVRELSITQPDAGGPPDRPESLQVDLTIQGLALLPRGQGTGDRGQREAGDSASAAGADTVAKGGAR